MRSMVVDANVIFAVLIAPGKTDELFFKKDLVLFAPLYILEEIGKYQQLLRAKTKRSDNEFRQVFSVIKRMIRFVTPQERFVEKSIPFCPDLKDLLYIALALQLGCPLWSNDKALKSQDKVKVLSTEELLRLL